MPAGNPLQGVPADGPIRGMLRGGRVMAVVDLNSAPLSELQTLPGVTLDYAQKIVASRPFHSFADVERAGIPRGVVENMSPPAIIKSIETGPPPDPQRLDASPVIPRGAKP
jgi:hypothetical protein